MNCVQHYVECFCLFIYSSCPMFHNFIYFSCHLQLNYFPDFSSILASPQFFPVLFLFCTCSSMSGPLNIAIPPGRSLRLIMFRFCSCQLATLWKSQVDVFQSCWLWWALYQLPYWLFKLNKIEVSICGPFLQHIFFKENPPFSLEKQKNSTCNTCNCWQTKHRNLNLELIMARP